MSPDDGIAGSPSTWATVCKTPEFWLLVFCAVVFLVGVALGLPINYPSAMFTSFVSRHYLLPMCVAAGLQLAFTVFAYARRRTKLQDPYLAAKLLPFVAAITFFHFNFKAWMPLVNPANYDEFLFRCDQAVSPLITGFLWIRSAVALHAPMNVDSAYHGLFVLMFFLSLAVHAVRDDQIGQRKLVFGICAILAAGGVAYWIMPAVGPFLYRTGANELSHTAQIRMLISYHQVRQTGQLPVGYFIAPLAAMPSLHIARSLFLLIMAKRVSRVLFCVYLLITTWIVIESVASGWHYIADLPAGALLAVAVLMAIPRLYAAKETEPATRKEPALSDADSVTSSVGS